MESLREIIELSTTIPVNRTETLLSLYKLSGQFELLNFLYEKSTINSKIYNQELTNIQNTVIQTVALSNKILSKQELIEIFDYVNQYKYNLGNDALQSHSAGISYLLNAVYLLGVAIFLCGGFAVCNRYILPLLLSLSVNMRICLAYSVSGIVIAYAYVAVEFLQGYISFIGALLFGFAYGYHIAVKSSEESEVSISLVILPIVLIWGTLAVVFQSKLIGFITVAALETMLGFVIYKSPMCTTIGFTEESSVPTSFLTSGILLGFYIYYVINVKQNGMLSASVISSIETFEVGILFLCTFVTFLSLILLSSKWFHDMESKSYLSKYISYNIVALLFGLTSFYLGSINLTLGLFRGVASTFFVLYLMEKYCEIPWGSHFPLALFFGGIVLIFGVFQLKSKYL